MMIRLVFFVMLSLIVSSCGKVYSNQHGKNVGYPINSKDNLTTNEEEHELKSPINKGLLHCRIKKTSKEDYNWVYLINETSSSIIYQTQDGTPIIIQEALDQNGEWKTIEYWTKSTCGNSYYTRTLGVDQFTFFKVNKYDGDFMTKIRIRIEINDWIIYSNPYKSRINSNLLSVKLR